MKGMKLNAHPLIELMRLDGGRGLSAKEENQKRNATGLLCQQYGGKHTNNQQTGQRCTGSRRKTMGRGKERGMRLEGCSLPRNKVSRSGSGSKSLVTFRSR